MPQFGSNPSTSNQNLSSTQDINGNAIISSDNTFGASPLGIAARTQALYGLPNGHFDLTCPDPNLPVEVDNAIPYWDMEYSGAIETTMVYNATTQNWSVRLDPTGAETDDFVTLKARTFLLNDDAIALRQKAFASLTKVGTTGTAQWSIVLSATYYDATGTQLSTYNIGTAADTGTWTGINGVTTSGSAAIDAAALYADIALTLTAAGSVSGTAKVDINSVLIGTSEAAAGGGGFLLTEIFLASGTWTVPTGVDYVDVAWINGGAGGDGGGALTNNTGGATANGGAGGRGQGWNRVNGIYVGDVGSVSVGIGAGGAGGAGASVVKAVGVTTSPLGSASGSAGAAGGATTFGAYLTDPLFGVTTAGGAGTQGAGGGGTAAGGSGGSWSGTQFTSIPFAPAYVSTGAVGGTATGSGAGSYSVGGSANTLSGLAGAGGGGGGAVSTSTPGSGVGGVGGRSASGSGGGGGASNRNLAGTITVTGGNGGNAPTANYGGGGGGGGGAAYTNSTAANYNNNRIVLTGGSGGNGSSGWLQVIWIG
jgi:hypothetical protein